MKDLLIRLIVNWIVFLACVGMTFVSLSQARFGQGILWVFISSLSLVKIYKMYQ